jgi:hypothetical protein
MAKTLAGILAVTMAALLFAGCGGGDSATTIESSTSATTIAALSPTQIEELLPSNTELPVGWSTKVAVEAIDDFTRGVLDVGLCFGQKTSAYATAQNVTHYASTDYQMEGSRIQSKITVYGFPSAAAANSFMSLSIPSCPGGKVGQSQYNFLTQKVSAPVAGIAGVDDSYMFFEDLSASGFTLNAPYSKRSVIFSRSRVGDVVFEISMAGVTSDENDLSYKPNYETTKNVSEQIVKAVRQRMGVRPKLPASTTTTIR